MSHDNDYPIILGKHLRKGMMLFPNLKMGGMDLAIVWLKKDMESGETFELSDVEAINAVIHFCDRGTMKMMADTLKKAWEGWEEDGRAGIED